MPHYTEDDAVRIVRQYEREVTARGTWDGVWAALAALERPLRVDVRTRRASGAQQTQAIFDGTAPKAASDLASAIYGSLSPADMQFFRLVMRYKPLNDVHEVQLWLEECEARLLLAFQQSNFESETHEMYQDLVVFGTGCQYMEERPSPTGGFGGFRFRTVPPGRYTLLEGEDGRVTEVKRMFTLTLDAAMGLWKDTLSDASKEKHKNEPDEKVEILHVMRPTPQYRGPGRRTYESVYIEYAKKTILEQRYHRKLRFLVPRWSKTSEEQYGRGQGHLVYPTVATLNKAVEMRFKQWAKQIDPPVLTIDDGVIGKLRLRAGTRTIVRADGAIKPFETGARFDVAQFNEELLRVEIRNGFYADKLQLPNKQYMTAYEIQQQVEVMQRELGPTIGRVKNEYLTPVIDNGFDIMFYAGALPSPPGPVLEAAQAGLAGMSVEYESPLIRSQRTGDLVALDRTIQTIAPLTANNPEVMDNYDADWLARHSGEVAGLPAKGFRPLEQVESIRQEKQRQVAVQEQAAMEMQQSEVAKNQGQTAQHVAKAQEAQAAPKALPVGSTR